MAPKLSFTLLGVIIDLISLLTVFLPRVFLEVFPVKPFQRGFYCDDDSIKYPYRRDTVPLWIVLLVGISFPIVFIIAAEVCHSFGARRAGNHPFGYRVTSTCSMTHFVVVTFRVILAFLFGLATTDALTELCKYSIGRLRPSFLDVCRPNVTCDGVLSSYIDNFTCTGSTGFALDDARLSFMSGHASIAYYCAVFFAVYVQVRFTWKRSRLLKHLLQVVAVYVATYVATSRISDYQHHWNDVLMGALLGSFLAFFLGIHVRKMFQLHDGNDVWNDGKNHGQMTIDDHSNSIMLDIENSESRSAAAGYQYLAP